MRDESNDDASNSSGNINREEGVSNSGNMNRNQAQQIEVKLSDGTIPKSHVLIHKSQLSILKSKAKMYNAFIKNISRDQYGCRSAVVRKYVDQGDARKTPVVPRRPSHTLPSPTLDPSILKASHHKTAPQDRTDRCRPATPGAGSAHVTPPSSPAGSTPGGPRARLPRWGARGA